jgi:hypothetical protein
VAAAGRHQGLLTLLAAAAAATAVAVVSITCRAGHHFRLGEKLSHKRFGK